MKTSVINATATVRLDLAAHTVKEVSSSVAFYCRRQMAGIYTH